RVAGGGAQVPLGPQRAAQQGAHLGVAVVAAQLHVVLQLAGGAVGVAQPEPQRGVGEAVLDVQGVGGDGASVLGQRVVVAPLRLHDARRQEADAAGELDVAAL